MEALISFKTGVPAIGDTIDALFDGKMRQCIYMGMDGDDQVKLEVRTQDAIGKFTVYNGLASWRPINSPNA